MARTIEEERVRAELIAKAEAIRTLQYRKIDERCKREPLYWLRNWTATSDPHAVKKGVNPIKPFPDWVYFDYLFYFLTRPHEYPRMFIPKSRELVTSWSVAGYVTHACQNIPYTQVLVQTELERKVVKLVGYSKILYDQQPEWLRKAHPLKGGYAKTRPGRDKETELAWENGSEIIGIPSGPDQVPSYHPSIYIIDEAGLLLAAGESYDLAHPVCSQIIVVSTARPGWFAEQCDSNSIDIEATKEFVAAMASQDLVSA